MRRSAVLLAALALDLAWGEPPSAVHPVVGLGRLIETLERRARRGRPAAELVQGAALAASVVGIAAGAGWLVSAALRTARGRGERRLAWRTAAWLAEAWWVKTTLSARALASAALAVRTALENGELDEARRWLRWLVSRNTASLSPSLLAAAAIESVAENASDSVVAPALYYLALGLPGALGYRAINTLDAMLGYRGAYEWLGKASARLDDLANLAPARLTAALLVLAAAFDARATAAWRALVADRSRPASPNAGYPMSAMAGALGIELEKVGHYRLGGPARTPTPADIGAAVRLAQRAWLLACAALLGAQAVRLLWTAARAGRRPLQRPRAAMHSPRAGDGGRSRHAG